MRRIWFTSDTHFGHESIIRHCRPEFSSVEEMDETLIENWNTSVRLDDLVYHLGDFAWKVQDAKRVRPRLNGTIRLMVGNHDNVPALAATGMFQRIQLWRHFESIGMTATHVPLRADQTRHGIACLHGHVHGKVSGLEYFHRDVSVESTNYRPVPYDDVAAWAARING